MINYQKPVLVGHPFVPIGRGEDIRCSFRALQTVGYTLPIYDIYSYEKTDPNIEKEFSNHLVKKLSPTINIFYINGDEIDQVLDHINKDLLPGAYNIIYPQWELSIYPQEWSERLNRFDEIWAPSKFVFDTIKKTISKPIFHMPLTTHVQLDSFLGRRYFNIPESSYVFLFFFDFRSYIDRKNPITVVNTFKKVCENRPNDDIYLIVKINRPDSLFESDVQKFIDTINKGSYKDRIIIIDKVFTDNEIKNLVRCCDCFISLHRSEGFGRGMAEAMFLGKPVIATGYSGNLDFMNDDNSCLVRYKLIYVKEGCYPYAKGQIWADPDVEHAVNHMIKLMDDRNYGRELGNIASRHIRTYFNYVPIGIKYKDRIDNILHTKRYK